MLPKKGSSHSNLGIENLIPKSPSRQDESQNNATETSSQGSSKSDENRSSSEVSEQPEKTKFYGLSNLSSNPNNLVKKNPDNMSPNKMQHKIDMVKKLKRSNM